jgi:hypothetical protein
MEQAGYRRSRKDECRTARTLCRVTALGEQALAKIRLREFTGQVMKNELTFHSRSHDFHLPRRLSVA